jgi:hypothetical protein
LCFLLMLEHCSKDGTASAAMAGLFIHLQHWTWCSIGRAPCSALVQVATFVTNCLQDWAEATCSE